MLKPNNSLFKTLNAIRRFFADQEFDEVLTPPMVPNPGMETHIHPFEIYSAKEGESTGLYLHTSPEFYMKKLLSQGWEKIYSLNYSFRDEPESPLHRKQFLMLEWYRANEHLNSIKTDCSQLINYCANFLLENNMAIDQSYLGVNLQEVTVQELFQEYVKIDILDFLDKNELRSVIAKDHKDIPLPASEKLTWDDYYFLLFLNKIEPHFSHIPAILISQFPAPLAALSKLNERDPRVCERFEIYLKGIELCNCFYELTDLEEQKKRFEIQSQEKFELYQYTLPSPDILYNSLRTGLPTSSGIALGVERLCKAITKDQDSFFE